MPEKELHRATNPFVAGKYALKRTIKQYQFFLGGRARYLASLFSPDCYKTSGVGALRVPVSPGW